MMRIDVGKEYQTFGGRPASVVQCVGRSSLARYEQLYLAANNSTQQARAARPSQLESPN